MDNIYWRNGHPFPTIPTAYVESRTYLEMVLELTNQFNALAEFVNESLKNLNEYTDLEIEKLKQYLIEYNDRTNQELESSLKGYTDLEISKLKEFTDNAINILDYKIDFEIGKLKSYVDNQDNEIYEYIDNQVIDIKVWDNVTGRISTIQEALDSLYSLHRDFALTVSEYDSLELSTQAYDDKQLSSNDFDFNGKNLLP